MRFTYRFFEGHYYPFVPIKLKGRSFSINAKVFVDTGANFSVFHADIAMLLDLKLKNGERKEVVVGDGRTITAYLHQLQVSLARKEFTATIGFSEDIDVGFYILGRKDIFEKFIICFNEKDKWIEFTSVE